MGLAINPTGNSTSVFTSNCLTEIDLPSKVQEYCKNVDHTSFILLIIAGLFWLLEPLVYKQVQKLQPKSAFLQYLLEPEGVMQFYKWIGLGILFMAGYVLWTVR
jgi:hypothetical protein